MSSQQRAASLGIGLFDAAIHDPGDSTRMRAAFDSFDSGDHLHPNVIGMQAIADGIIGLELLQSLAAAARQASGTTLEPAREILE